MIAALGIYVILVALLICCFFQGAGQNREYDLAEQARILEGSLAPQYRNPTR